MFTHAWQALEHEGKPTAGVEGDALWVECQPAELREKHLPALESAVAQANQAFRPSLQQKALVQRAERQLSEQARAQLRELGSTLQAEAAPVEPPPKAKKSFFAAIAAAVSEFKRARSSK